MINKYISEIELKKFGEINNFSAKATALLQQQKLYWNLVNNNFDALDGIKIKDFSVGGDNIRTQFNPSRIISSSAKVDKESIENRKCFLCEKNLPSEQKGISFFNKYTILCNPFPIFKEHLTIPNNEHMPQNIENAFSDLLKLSYELRHNFFVFYNGPKCGASAPDHLHFQAGLKNSTPLEEVYQKLIEEGEDVYSNNNIKISIVARDIYRFISVQSKDEAEIEQRFFAILKKLKELNSSNEEPLLNLICFYSSNKWNLFIIPRKQHRPSQFFLDGNEKLLISPASVDMAGLLIVPREEDFNKLSQADIKNIYSQVLFDLDKISLPEMKLFK
jgi:ATP adenylyltransferase/5',5'''-P-1,P-4-tetraphosphate phosphorylase II